ncbi:MAG: choice-of-anchor D domain-containing protein [Acidobacteria bacterium]|nr:MAG: choice-of-anchor D domain-containing protein [Acidobacteriota bacterium]
MGEHRDAPSFSTHSCRFFRSLIHLPLIGLFGLVMCLAPDASFTQQRTQPPRTESANIIRLRQQWFYQQRAYPNKKIPAGARLKAYQQFLKMQTDQRRQFNQQSTTSATSPATDPTFATALSTTAWTLIGPRPTSTPFKFNPVSGRVTALAVDPTNSNTIYLGGAEGGVWKSTDGGTTWVPLTDNQPSLAVGSIAIDPQNPQIIYVGTGEQDFALYNYSGAGILKSTNGGASWTLLSGPFVGPFGSDSPFCGGAYIGSIAVDPGNSQVVLADAEFQCSNGTGLYRSTNGGTTWTEVLGTPAAPDLITGLVYDPANGNNVYAAVGASTSASNDGIWKSTNAGLNWTLANGSGTTAFPGPAAARISLAIAASSPATLYAGAASSSSGSTSVLGVYKTTNGGGSWTQLTSAPNYCSPDPATAQCYFDNVVAVAPNNSNIVLLGGSESATTEYVGTLFLSLDGGSTWKDITADSAGNAIHPDMHSLAFSSDGSKMLVGNDGGLWSTPLSSTGVGTWTNLNQSLALTQFYPGLSMHPTDPNTAFAGSQDNGIQEYNGSLAWGYVGCGDGGQTAFNYSDLNTLYLTCQYMPPNTLPNGSTADFLYKLTANPPTAVAADSGIDGADNGAFIPPLTMDPSDPNTLYFGTYRLYQTTNAAAAWKSISTNLTSGAQNSMATVSAIAVAPGDSNTVYIGTGDGRLWMTSGAESGFCCSYITNSTPNRSVTAIAINPTNAQTAYATFSGYSGFNDTQGHVFKTTNAGANWTDISGNLPNIPVNDIVVDPDIPNTLYAGTDVGLLATTNGGSTWSPLGTGLPAVVIMSLKLHHATRILRAASYGRSAWDIQLPTPVGPTAVLSTPTLDFVPQQAGTTSAAQTVTLTNNSSTALSISGVTASSNFAETNTCGTGLAAGANCAISVTFTPTTFGSLTGTVTIADNAAGGSSQIVNLKGKGFSGAVTLSPTNLAFGNQTVGTISSAQIVTLTNSSPAPLTITQITKPGDFNYTTDCPLQPSTLAGGASCHISVTFSPTVMGTIAEQITVADSANDSPQIIPVTGTGLAPLLIFSPISLDFGYQKVGTSTNLTTTLSNTGTADLTITSISSELGAPFTETNNCPLSPSTILSGGSCTATFTFAPTMWGQYGVSPGLLVTDNAFNSSEGFGFVGGKAYSGAVTLSSSNVSFGNVRVGQTATQTVSLMNSGDLPLYIPASGNFTFFGDGNGNLTQTNNCPLSPSSLGPGGTCTFTFSFTPAYSGGLAMNMNVDDSAAGFNQTISLTGSGTSPDFTVSVSGTFSTTVSPGGTATYTVAVQPVDGFNQTITLACSGAPTRAACSVSPASVTLDGTNSQNVKVTVTTTAPSLAPPWPRGGPPSPGNFAFHNWWLALLWLLMMGPLAIAFKQRSRWAPLLASAVLLAAISMSCGGGGGGGGGGVTNPGTPAGTYTLTVTGVSGTLQHSTTLAFTVQ